MDISSNNPVFHIMGDVSVYGLLIVEGSIWIESGGNGGREDGGGLQVRARQGGGGGGGGRG